MDHASDSDAMATARSENLKNVRGNILEIGFGVGHSLAHYPPNVEKVSILDSNKKMLSKATKRIERSDINITTYVADTSFLPFADQTFEHVVSHMTLCSILDVREALFEVHRILKKGGYFVFLEHGACPDKKTNRWQGYWNPIQKVIGGGCNCNRDIDTLIASSGLEIIELKNYHMGDAPKVLDYMYQGVAIKK